MVRQAERTKRERGIPFPGRGQCPDAPQTPEGLSRPLHPDPGLRRVRAASSRWLLRRSEGTAEATTHPRTSKPAAFTLLELLIVLVVIAILAGLFLPFGMSPRRKAARIQCVNQLKNIGLGLRIFPKDQDGHFPWQISTNQGGSREYLENPTLAWPHFHALSNELSMPSILICPADRGVLKGKTWATTRTNRALSYFLGLQAREEQPSSILAGDSNLELDGRPLRTELVLVRTNNILRFDNTRHEASGNILLGDGSVQQVTIARFQEAVRDSWILGLTNRWLIP